MNFSHFTHDAFSLLTLLFLEIILGIDNIVFISIISHRLPAPKQATARFIGLSLALIMRLILLATFSWVARFTHPLLTVYTHTVSARDLLLGCGGLFLLYKGTQEIHAEFTPEDSDDASKPPVSLAWAIGQIVLLDLVFSLDSVITAIGMTQVFWIMATAVTVSIIFMMIASASVSRFIQENPPLKILAISFIIMIGMVLLADALHFHVPRAYLYFSIAFSLSVEVINTLLRRRRQRLKGSSKPS